MSKKVILTGITGQFGSYMAEYLLANTDYEIYGMTRRLSVQNHKNILHLKDNPRLHLFSGDLNDEHSLYRSISEILPDFYINAGAQSFVSESWISPVNTFNTDTIAIIHILEAIRKLVPHCRFLNMGSSEEFGDVLYSPQDMKHPFRARSPYGAAKIAAHQLIKTYRESYNLYAIQAVAFNYESKRRGEEFLTRKVTKGVARIYHALKSKQSFAPIELGQLDSRRDWSHASDIVDGVWKMLNQDTSNPKEYILSSGRHHTVRDFVVLAFQEAGINGCWINGQTLGSTNAYDPQKDVFAIAQKNGAYPILVSVNPKFYRPADVNSLLGDSSPIRMELNWQPKVSFEDLVQEMVRSDIFEFSQQTQHNQT